MPAQVAIRHLFVSPGAEVWLRGWGGLRARILTDGSLRRGPVEHELVPSAEPAGR